MAHELIRRERRKDRARATQRRSAPSNKALAASWGKDQTSTSHYANGRAEEGPIFKDLEGVWLSAHGRKTSPYPEVAELLTLIREAHFGTWSDDALVAHWWALRDEEHDKQAAEDRASQSRDLLTYNERLGDEAWHQLELQAAGEELMAREIDPFREDA